MYCVCYTSRDGIDRCLSFLFSSAFCCCCFFSVNSSAAALFESGQSVCGRWWWWRWRRWRWWVSNVRMSPESGDCDWFLFLCQWCSACSISAHLTAPVTGCVSSHIYIFSCSPLPVFALMQAEPGCNPLNSHHRCLRAIGLRSDQKSCFLPEPVPPGWWRGLWRCKARLHEINKWLDE